MPGVRDEQRVVSARIGQPAIGSARVDLIPYGQSMFADTVDTIHTVDPAFNAMISRDDNGKNARAPIRCEIRPRGGRRASIPFRRRDCTMLREVISTEEINQEFAPALHSDAPARALRTELQMLRDLCEFGISLFDFDGAGYMKRVTEVPNDNSALMRNIHKHKRILEKAIVGIYRTTMMVSRLLNASLLDDDDMQANYTDGIVADTAAEKQQSVPEVADRLKEPAEAPDEAVQSGDII